MLTIKNKKELIQNGETAVDRKARLLALDCLESALNAADPKRIIRSRVLLKNLTLHVDECYFDLTRFKNLYVIGGGKATGSMAEALENVLGRRITLGFVNVPHGSKHKTKTIALHGASHPMPDEAGVEGVRRMLEIADQAKKDDLVICLISGGGSSLMPLPRDGISIDDKREITEALLRCGATINEINTVRKHISDFKGGWLAKKAYPATVLNLILSDVVGDPLDFIASGPTVPDSTTFADALGTLKKYGLWDKAPAPIKKVLSAGVQGAIPETPKANDKAFQRVFNVVIGNNRLSSRAACEHLQSKRLNTLLLTATLEGEANEVGTVFASIAHEVGVSGNPIVKPAGIVAGGETTVKVSGRGLGGRNQELVLSSAVRLASKSGLVVASLSTDGVDGPTDAAGAIADGRTLARASQKRLAPERYLADNDSYHLFSELGDLIFTGPTGTNVNDVSVAIVT